MGRTEIPITAFDKGIVCALDKEDVSENAAVYSEDVDPAAVQGTLRGRFDDTLKLSQQANEAAFLVNGAQWDLVYRQAGGLRVAKDWYGAKTDGVLALPSGVSLNTGLSFIRRGRELHVGNGKTNPPLWIGYTPWKHFGVADDGTVRCVRAECLHLGGNDAKFGTYIYEVSANSGSGYFTTGKEYRYAHVYVYDGFQRSPLYETHGGAGGWQGRLTNLGQTADYVDVKISATDPVSPYTGEAIPPRVTAIELYRAVVESGEVSPGYFMLVGTLDLTAELPGKTALPWSADTSTSNGITARLFRFRDTGEAGMTYEAQAGVPEAVDNSMLKYELSCECMDYLFVGNCAHDEVPDAGMMLFRSKAHRFDMFNWVEEYLLLPITPVAMASYGGKLFVFDESSCLRINPENLSVEETLPGVGAAGRTSVLSTEAGLFVFGKYNCHLVTAGSVIPIGDPIRVAQSGGSLYTPISITGLKAGGVPMFAWDSNGGRLLALVNTVGSTYGILVYTVVYKRWDYWRLDKGGWHCIVSGKYGEVLLGGDEIYELGASLTRRTATWIGSVLTFGSATQKKKVYELKLSGTGTVTYAKDGGAWTALQGNHLGPGDWLCTSIQCKVVVAPTQEVRSIEAVYRRLEGLR